MRLLAAFLPVTAVLYIGAEALDPRGTDQVVTNTATALRLLPIASAHSSQLYLSGSLSVLALIAALEAGLQIRIPTAQVQPDDFDSVLIILETIARVTAA